MGQEAIAVADGTVVKVVDGLPEQEPGVFPENISLEEADGNSVILDIGGGNYALYAHFQPGSIRVKEGDRVKQGDVLALVGSSGNSLAPHLYFHVMDGPLSLASNGLPYIVDSFMVTGQSPGTEAFNKAEQEGTRLEVTLVDPAKRVTGAMPLDQLVVDFDCSVRPSGSELQNSGGRRRDDELAYCLLVSIPNPKDTAVARCDASIHSVLY
jgi:murein DD-endopeptidase MepM/ murein hydrolase activator NlpD